MNDRALLPFYFMSPLSKNNNRENTSQFKSVKVSSSNKVIDLLTNKTKLITLYNTLLTIRDTD